MNPSLRTVLRLYAVVIVMAAVTGAACAFFLWALEAVTVQRFAHPWLLWLLPVAGFAVGLLYHYRGGGSDAGNNLILDRIHEPGGGVPRRMAPLVLLGTLVTHLCGGSAGREGTAVQMGGSIAGAFCRHLRLGAADIPVVLMAGVAAGFGAVFGTPLAGTVFALEVLTIGRIRHSALLPCFVAALTGDWTCRALGATHTHYQINWHANPLTAAALTDVDVLLLGKIALAALGFGLAARFFAGASHWLSGTLRRLIPWAPLRPVAGGLAVIALVLVTGTRDFLGLGVWSADPEAVSIVRLFTSPEIHPWAWLGKLVFTVVTLSAGFKGGEVTPLFFIGAALGNALAGVLGAPPDLFAALGFVAIFAGATNTPLACTLMGMELFGATHSLYLGAACFLAWKVSGSASIYASQRRTPPDDVPAA